METLTAEEIVKKAVEVEKNGKEFYEKAAEKSGNEKVKQALKKISEEEIKHKEIFLDMLEETKHREIKGEGTGEFMGYLQHYYGNKELFDFGKKEKFSGIKEVIDFAMQKELDSVGFYREFYGLVNNDGLKNLDRIIAEEKTHFVRLYELKKEFA